MIEIVLDTETTGLSVEKGHRIIEIGCIELKNQIPTKRFFHSIVNPKRPVSEDAYKVHGYSDSFLSTKKEFSEIANDFLEFIKGKKLIIHNAEFDLAFLNLELKLIKKEPILKEETSKNIRHESDETIKKIMDVLDTKIRPAVSRDGGDIKFKSFEKGVVKVELQGSCSGCPSSLMTLKQGVQNLLKHYVKEVDSVEAS